MAKEKNELRPEYLGIHATNSFADKNSASRSVMYASHFAQRLVIEGATEKRIQTGVEREFGKYTFSVKMPENGRIIKIIERFPRTAGQNALKFNPETIVIYENDETKEIDYFTIPYYLSLHQFFGFKYELNHEAISMLNKPSAYIAKDTIFADSPGVSKNSGYKYGIELNVAFLSVPSASEDGMMISRDVVDRLKFRVYETRVVEFGANNFPLNMFGTKDYYKPFLDIGEYLTDERDDGILMMLRSYDNDLMPVEMSILDTLEPDFTFDKGVYVRSAQKSPNFKLASGPNGRIIDIKVIRNNSSNRQLPAEMCVHLDKYERANLKFHQEILETEEKLRYERKKKFGEGKLKLSPKLHQLVVQSLAIVNHNPKNHKQELSLLYRKAPIDEYRVEFVIEYEIVPNIGFKLTDLHGGKGVFCKIEEPENMPVDEDGNRADLVVDSASTLSRMNLGRLYEHYFGAAARDVSKAVRRMTGIAGNATVSQIERLNPTIFEQAYQYLLGFYQIVSEKQYDFFAGMLSPDERWQHLADVINEGAYLYMPIDNQKDTVETVKEVEKYYKPTYGPVSYVGDSGQRVTTKSNVRIAPLYMMLLDKIADDWSSVSSGKLQHFGVLSPMTKSEKFSYPFRNSPVRTIGETEGRIFAGYCGREAIAEMMDRSNSPMTQRNVVWNILNAGQPTNMQYVVDRNYVPLGTSRPLQLVKHIMSSAGFLPVFEPEDRPDLKVPTFTMTSNGFVPVSESKN